jgi:hypothetical protein
LRVKNHKGHKDYCLFVALVVKKTHKGHKDYCLFVVLVVKNHNGH